MKVKLALFICCSLLIAMSCKTFSNNPVQISDIDFSCIVDNEEITFENGIFVKSIPDSAAQKITKYLGYETKINILENKMFDRVFLITQETGGSGTFFYIVGAINNNEKLIGTNAVFIGDRISVQNVYVKPNTNNIVVVEYFERNIESDSLELSKQEPQFAYFKIENNSIYSISE